MAHNRELEIAVGPPLIRGSLEALFNVRDLRHFYSDIV